MTSSNKRTSILLLVLTLPFTSSGSLPAQNLPVILSVSLANARIHGSSLSFDWQLANHSTKPLYVYATFLNGPAVLPPANQAGIIKVRTSLNAREPVAVNAYPAARFLLVEPGSLISGRFSEKKLDRDVLVGAKKVEMQVAFGFEVDKLKREISSTAYNGEHPANPIVAWQTVAFGQTELER
jgi:hypothetical protein